MGAGGEGGRLILAATLYTAFAAWAVARREHGATCEAAMASWLLLCA